MAKVAIVILNWNGQQMLAKYLPNVVEYSPVSYTHLTLPTKA